MQGNIDINIMMANLQKYQAGNNISINIMMANLQSCNFDNKNNTKAICILLRPHRSPDSDDSPDSRRQGNNIYQIGKGGGGYPNGGDDGDNNDHDVHTSIGAGGRSEGGGREFSVVKYSNIIIQVFSGKNLNNNNNPYLPFNKSLKRLIYNRGANGEQLLEILEGVDK